MSEPIVFEEIIDWPIVLEIVLFESMLCPSVDKDERDSIILGELVESVTLVFREAEGDSAVVSLLAKDA